MIADLRQNIQNEIALVRELAGFVERSEQATGQDKVLADKMVDSLKSRIKILNRSNVDLVKNTTLSQPLTPKAKVLPIERVVLPNTSQRMVLRSSDKGKYLRELDMSDELVKHIKKREVTREVARIEFKKPNLYAQLANRFFLDYSSELIKHEYFKDLNLDLRRANINVLTSTYVSMMLFSTLIAFLGGLILAVFLLFVSVSMTMPFFTFFDGSYLLRFGQVIWIIAVAPAATFGAFYFFPYAQRSSLSRAIESELPFVVIHMGSISGSGVEPSQIFRIVGMGKDYPATGGELRKVLNQVNIYGYDLLTALKNIARLTPSARLAELLLGLSTTISSGGDLKLFFEKRAETLLLNYRLEREKFTKVAETFMDIYISVVIATPMILLLLLVMISVSGVGFAGFTIEQMAFLIIFLVALINIVFLWAIGLRQPSY